jgi:AraC-like DNA-binding protein
MTLADIAESTGYCTASHLSNTFSEATGMSPRAWRKSHENDVFSVKGISRPKSLQSPHHFSPCRIFTVQASEKTL